MTKLSGVADAQRDDGSPSAVELISAYERGVADLRTGVSGMTSDELRRRPIAGKWSTLEVVCHISDCEQFFADRMKRTLAMERPLLIGAEGFRYPEPLQYHQRDLVEELELVALTRRQIAHILRLVSTEAWGRTAVHTETGMVTLRQLLLHAVNHLAHHLRFIAEKRAALERTEDENSPPFGIAVQARAVDRPDQAELPRIPTAPRVNDLTQVESSCAFATPRLRLLGVAGTFAVCKLPIRSPIPPWAMTGDCFSITRTADELSAVCRQEVVPEGIVCERGWRCLRVEGTMPFTMVGVLASLTNPIAKAGVSVFSVSTFDTDYLLIKASDMPTACASLRSAGHLVEHEGVMP
jgi:uncharacterized damage-inducible protein DinB